MRKHPFFKDVDWKQLALKRDLPPIDLRTKTRGSNLNDLMKGDEVIVSMVPNQFAQLLERSKKDFAFLEMMSLARHGKGKTPGIR